MSSVQIQKELEYTKKIGLESYLKNYRISPVSGNPTKFLSSPQVVNFEIPGNIAFAFDKISLTFERGSIALLAGYYNAIPSSYIPFIERLELRSSNGTILCDISNIPVYNRLCMPLLNNYKDNTRNNGGLYPSNAIVLETAATNLQGSDPYIDNKLNANAFPGELSCNTESLLRYSNFEWSKVGAALPARKYVIQLSDLLSDSIFNVKSQIFNGRNLYLKIQFASYKQWLYRVKETGTDMSNTDPTADITFNNLTLNLQVEANEKLVEMIKQKQGDNNFNIIIPETTAYNQSISNAVGYRNIINKISNPGQATLYKFYAGLVSGNPANVYTVNNTSNYNDKKYSSYEIYLNTTQLINVNTTENQDLDYVIQTFKNHSFSDLSSFKVVSPVVYVFNCSPIYENKYDGCTVLGKSFDNPQGEQNLNIRYNIVASEADSYVNPNNQTQFTAYCFSVVMKPLYINSMGDFQLLPFM